MSKQKLSEKHFNALISTLKDRFMKNIKRHPGIDWEDVEASLKKNNSKTWSILQMELSGGEPDIIAFDKKTKLYTFCDCSIESPSGRRSLCYDRLALNSRKENKPKNTVIDMADEMGIQLLNEEDYRQLQTLGKFDLKTSSWILTPSPIRTLKGALFCDRRYDHVFTYHNGAESYYAARGFRGFIKI